MTTRAEILAIARSYLGTPFHHEARTRNVGIDCAGLLICVMRDAGIKSRDWDIRGYGQWPDGSLIRHCDAHLIPITKAESGPGDVVAVITDKNPQHLGIIAPYHLGGLGIIHASNASNPPRVIETRLMYTRNMRFVAAYRFPGVA